MIHPRTLGQSLKLDGRDESMQCVLLAETFSNCTSVLQGQQTEGLCVVRRNERYVDRKRKRERQTERSARSGGPQLITRLIERENKAAWMFIAISQS